METRAYELLMGDKLAGMLYWKDAECRYWAQLYTDGSVVDVGLRTSWYESKALVESILNARV